MSAQLSGSRHGPGRVDFGHAVVRVRAGRLRGRFAVRSAVTAAVLAGISVVLALVALTLGDYPVPLTDVMLALTGQEAGTANLIVVEWRAPRALAALVFGAALGVSGAIFQSLTRNPLASPDIIGISSGASAAAAFGIIVLGLDGSRVSALAITAALAVSALIYLLSWRGGVLGTRLILIGIGIAAVLDAVTNHLLDRAGQGEVQDAMRWLVGSLNNTQRSDVTTTTVGLVVLGGTLLVLARNLTTMQLGDDAAQGLGVRVERTRAVVVVCAVGLIAIATSAAGPIAFVAFLCGPITARLVGPGRSLFVPAALVGALLVLVADFAGQYAFGARFPVGVITGALGAPFLVYLIVRGNRTGGNL